MSSASIVSAVFFFHCFFSSGSILGIRGSNSLLLLVSSRESTFPWITKNLLFVTQLLFWSVAENLLLTSRSDWSIFSVSLLGCSHLTGISCDLCLRALKWYSFIAFALAPLSGSTCELLSPILMTIVS